MFVNRSATYNKYEQISKKVLYVDKRIKKRHHSQTLHGTYGSNKKIWFVHTKSSS